MLSQSQLISKDPWVKVYDIMDTVKHRKGYTIYKVVSKVFPRDSVEAITEVSVWKRYSDFRKLNKSLFALHQSLHLKGSFPKFTQARYFGRFDQEVIEERKKCCSQLLQFVSENPTLYNSQVFVRFFEDGQESELCSEENKAIFTVSTDVLIPEKLEEHVSSVDSATDGSFEKNECDQDRNLLVPLNSTWNHHQSTEDISLNSDSSDCTDDKTETSKADLSLFDPLTPSDAIKKKYGNPSNSWLISAIQSCVVDDSEPDNSSAISYQFPEPFANEDFRDSVQLKPNVPIIKLPDDIDSNLDPVPSSKYSEPTLPHSHCIKEESEIDQSYLVKAAEIISLGKSYEAECNYNEAFSRYKDAVGVLLIGAQGETDSETRDTVRRKITQYLRHAEFIYSEQLADTFRRDNLRWAATAFKINHSPGLHGPLEELRKYRVLGIVGRKLLLVLDLSCNQTRVMKCLQKISGAMVGLPNIVPQFIPFMVELLKVYETEDCLYLVLKVASGGKLWDYVSSYLERNPISPPEPCALISESEVLVDVNVYSGKKLNSYDDETIETHGDNMSMDLDLAEPPECSRTHVELFNNNIASVQTDEMAECTLSQNYLVTNEKDRSVFYQVAECQPVVCSKSEQNSIEMDDDSFSTLKTTSLDIDNMIQHSKALLRTVDQTLNATSVSATLDKAEFKLHDKTEKSREYARPPRNLCLVQKPTHSNHFNSRPNNSFKKPVEMSRRLSSSMGSLELRGPTQRVRQLSEIFHQLDANRHSSTSPRVTLPESCVRIWAAEIVTALAQLHLLGIIWQDLNPDNILLGDRGHILVTYVCRWNCVDRHLNSKPKTNMYAAPEVGGIFPITPSCDWWSLGALLYELLTGKSLVQSHPTGITSHTRLLLPSHLSIEAKDVLEKLLRYHPPERLGAGTQGIESLRDHPFFTGIDWLKLVNNK